MEESWSAGREQCCFLFLPKLNLHTAVGIKPQGASRASATPDRSRTFHTPRPMGTFRFGRVAFFFDGSLSHHLASGSDKHECALLFSFVVSQPLPDVLWL